MVVVVALPDVPKVFRVSINGTIGGVAYANVIHCHYQTGTAVQTDAQAVADGVRNAFKNNILTQLAPSFILGSTVAQDLTSQTSPVAIAAGSDVGGAAGTPYPNNIAMCVSLKTFRRYKGGKGRMYLGGMLAGNQADPAHWAGAFITTMTTKFGLFYTAVNAITSTNISSNHMAIVHYVQNKVHLSSPLVDDVQSYSIDSRIDTQRRRLG
jgi:hypothetical protein